MNGSDEPLELLYMMPVSQTFTLSSITVDFTLVDGTRKSVSTRIVEKERAKEIFEDKIA